MKPELIRLLALAAFTVWAWVWALCPELPWEISGCGLVASVLALAGSFEPEHE